jgi:CubicO group peptidase (beta-lactamase class C family)
MKFRALLLALGSSGLLLRWWRARNHGSRALTYWTSVRALLLALTSSGLLLRWWRARNHRSRALALLKSVRGHTAAGFEPVRKAFLRNVREGLENPGGAQLAICCRGQLVVDLTAGEHNDDHRRRRIVNVFSSGKALESLCVAKLVDLGRLSYDAPIGTYWPAFATRVSPHVTVADLMRHKSGLCGWRHPFASIEDARRTFCDPALAEEYLLSNLPAEWDAHTEHRQAYHAFTRGCYCNTLCRKVDKRGRDMVQFFRDEIAAPLGVEEDVMLCCDNDGVDGDGGDGGGGEGSSRRRNAGRVALHTPGEHILFAALKILIQLVLGIQYFLPYEIKALSGMVRVPLIRRVYSLVRNSWRGPAKLANDPVFRSCPMPSATTIGTAAAMATVMGAAASGKVLSQQGLEMALTPDPRDEKDSQVDLVLNRACRFSACGWGLERFGDPAYGNLPGWTGWAGGGGSVLMFHLKYQVSICYVPTRLEPRLWKPRAIRILSELSEVLKRGAEKRLEK